MKLVISLATRGRPAQVVETIKRSIVNWTHPNTVMQVQVDDDDIATAEAIHAAKFDPSAVLCNVMVREDTIAAKWNRALGIPADVYSVAADDDPYVSRGYDTAILEAAQRFPDGIGMVYGGMANLSFTGSLSMTAKLAEKLGYIQPALFPYWFVDHWTDDVVKMIGRISFADIRTDQSNVGKTQEMREPGWWATFFDACYLLRRREAFKIIDEFDLGLVPMWQKDILKSQSRLIEQRSRMINEGVRQNSRQLEGWSGLKNSDPRYQRVKQKALDMIPTLLSDPEMPDQEKAYFSNLLTPPTVIPSFKKAFSGC